MGVAGPMWRGTRRTAVSIAAAHITGGPIAAACTGAEYIIAAASTAPEYTIAAGSTGAAYMAAGFIAVAVFIVAERLSLDMSSIGLCPQVGSGANF